MQAESYPRLSVKFSHWWRHAHLHASRWWSSHIGFLQDISPYYYSYIGISGAPIRYQVNPNQIQMHFSQGYYLDECLVHALNEVSKGTHASNTQFRKSGFRSDSNQIRTCIRISLIGMLPKAPHWLSPTLTVPRTDPQLWTFRLPLTWKSDINLQLIKETHLCK